MSIPNIKIVLDKNLSKEDDILNVSRRYVIINADTGEILDNAQGYGFRSKESARKYWENKCRIMKKNEMIQKQVKGFLYLNNLHWKTNAKSEKNPNLPLQTSK